jgi:hypothetical protein
MLNSEFNIFGPFLKGDVKPKGDSLAAGRVRHPLLLFFSPSVMRNVGDYRVSQKSGFDCCRRWVLVYVLTYNVCMYVGAVFRGATLRRSNFSETKTCLDCQIGSFLLNSCFCNLWTVVYATYEQLFMQQLLMQLMNSCLCNLWTVVYATYEQLFMNSRLCNSCLCNSCFCN